MLKKFVNSVVKFFRSINIVKQNVVQNPVENRCLGKKVKSIRYVGMADVYCLTVPKTHNFLANGMVVHNSVDALRYAIYTHFFGKEASRMTANDLDKLYFEAHGSSYVLPKMFQDVHSEYIF